MGKIIHEEEDEEEKEIKPQKSQQFVVIIRRHLLWKTGFKLWAQKNTNSTGIPVWLKAFVPYIGSFYFVSLFSFSFVV